MKHDDFLGRELLRFFRRRAVTIFTAFLVMFIIFGSAAFLISPKYEAVALIEIAPSPPAVNDRTQQGDSSALMLMTKSQINTIKARVVTRVVQRLNLSNDSDFVGPLNESGPMAFIAREVEPRVAELFARLGIARPTVSEPEAEPVRKGKPDAFTVAEDKVRRNLDVRNDGRSLTIQLAYASTDPQRAASIVNAVAEEFVADQFERRSKDNRMTLEWLRGRIAELQKNVEESEHAADQFRVQHNLFTTQTAGTSMPILRQLLTDYNAQLVVAQIERGKAEARLRQGTASLEGKGGAVLSTTEAVNSLLLQSLHQREGEARQRIAESMTTLGPRHPRVIALQNELGDVRQKIREEANRIVQALAGEVESARARDQAIQAKIAELQRQAAASAEAEVQLRELERQVAANKQLYESYLARYKEVENENTLTVSRASVVATADVPKDALPPGKGLLLSIAACFSALLALLIAAAAERFSRGYWTTSEIEQQTGDSVLGLVPRIRRRGRAVDDFVLRNPATHFTEALQTIRVKFLLGRMQAPPMLVTVTSALPSEGKTVFSLSLARLMAQAGQRTLLGDGDLRRPRIPQALNSHHGPGFAELMRQEVALEDAIQVDPLSPLHFIASPRTEDIPHLIFDDTTLLRMKWLFRGYDIVVIDAPPILPVSDAGLLGKASDATIFVAQWAKTPKHVIVNALKLLNSFTDNVSGIVVTQVDMDKYAKYDDSRDGYVHQKHRKYYLKAG